MQWFPNYGVGFIAMGSTTYSGWGNAASKPRRADEDRRAAPRVATPSAALLERAQAITG